MKNVIVIYGGGSVEHDISVITAIQILNNIDKNLYNVIPIYINENKFFTMKNACNIEYYKCFNSKKWKELIFSNGYIFIKKLLYKKIKVDACILSCHGGIYEGGSLQGFLDINNIPYLSADVFISSLCMDKSRSKVLLKDLGFNIVDNVLINKDDFVNNKNNIIEKIEDKLDYPIIVKPNDQGSSIGINFSSNREQLINNITIAFSFSNYVIVEKALTNFTEFNCAGLNSSLGLTISDVEKPINFTNFLTFDNKYKSNNNKVEFPAKISKELENNIKNTTKDIFNFLNISGVARCDFLLDNNTNTLYVNEINTIPGSLAFYLFKNIIDFSSLLNILIESANFKNTKQNLQTFYKSDVLSSYENSLKAPFTK